MTMKARTIVDTILTFIKTNPEVLTYGVDVETHTWHDRREVVGIKIDNLTNKVVLIEKYKDIPNKSTTSSGTSSTIAVH